MSAELLTKDEFAMQELSYNSDKVLDGTLTGIVTYIKIDEGNHVLSRYEEDSWMFPPSMSHAGQYISHRTLNFAKIKKIEQQRMAKRIILQFMKEGKALGTLNMCLKNLSLYFQWVNNQEISELNAFTAREYVKYVNTLISNYGKYKGEPLSKSTKDKRFEALEKLYRHCNHFDFVKEHPWIESSAKEQAGLVGQVLADYQNKPHNRAYPR